MSATLAEASSFFALRRAALLAARGHRARRETAGFLVELETEVLTLQRALRSGTYRPAGFRTFRIRDPKPRTISVAPFRDRVVHHALCAVMEPTLEALADADSYACRVGMGNRAAVWRVQSLVRRRGWYAKLDVLHCFETVPVARLFDRLTVHFDDCPLLAAVATVLEAGADPQGRGLPIGNLTSQHFANFYLGAVDRLARERGVQGWCRYMDDMVICGGRRDEVVAHADAVSSFLECALGLREKRHARLVAPVHAGLPFLGFRIWPRRVRLDGARRRRLLHRLRVLERSEAPTALQRRAGALAAWAAHGDTRGLFASRGPPPEDV